jgi:ABC-type uncharacterized transport system permease subunit
MGKIKQFIISYWTIPVEIGIVAWAINGMLREYRESSYLVDLGADIEYHITPVLTYFLSAVLILYLLKKYQYKPK